MNLAIVGSRTYPNLYLVSEYINTLSKNTVIISGGAKGVDTIAKITAFQLHMSYKEFPANWKLYGKKAGFLRNIEIVNYANKIVAFWDSQSKGTLSTIRLAHEYNKRLLVFDTNGNELSEFVYMWL